MAGRIAGDGHAVASHVQQLLAHSGLANQFLGWRVLSSNLVSTRTLGGENEPSNELGSADGNRQHMRAANLPILPGRFRSVAETSHLAFGAAGAWGALAGSTDLSIRPVYSLAHNT
jgi:hypothetical protein